MKRINKKNEILSIQLIISICLLIFFPILSQADVTLSVGDGSGYRGSSENLVEVSLTNQENKVKAVQVEIRDVDDYLSCTGCGITERTAGFSCSTNEFENGCCRIILYYYGDDDPPPLIEEGTGPIFTIKYSVLEEAPEVECRELNPENISVAGEGITELPVTEMAGEFCFFNCSSDQDCDDSNICTDDACDGTGACVYSHNNDPCDDGIYCNGDDTCSDGSCSVHSGDPCLPDTECDEENDSCDPITTTTTSAPINTTTIPTITTTTILPSCKVSISPLSVTIKSGSSLQFSAKTTCGGEEIDGTYIWEIAPASTIGSSIDENTGFFEAGDNNSVSNVTETVKVTDTANGNKSATATVTIKVKEEPPPECEVTINPSSATVSSGGSLTLVASEAGDCKTPQYGWSLNSNTGSSIEPQGDTCLYTAGVNDGTEPLTDVLTVTDTINEIDADAVITILEEGVMSIEISPASLWKSHWIPLPFLLVIEGEGTHFKAFNTNLTFDPSEAVFSFWPFVLSETSVWNIILVMPSWLAGEGDQTVTLTVTTEGEVASKEFDIKLLPLILDQQRGLE